MRGSVRGVIFGLLLLATWLPAAVVPSSALAQTPAPQTPPFSRQVEVWTSQLDRIADRASQPDLLQAEIDTLRQQTTDVRSEAAAAAAQARGELADTRRLLAPLQPATGPDGKPVEQAPETAAVKAEHQRLTDQASISESRVKQSEVVIVRANQLLERLAALRSEVTIEALLHRGISPLLPQTWRHVPGELKAAGQTLSTAMATWRQNGLKALRAGQQDLTPLAGWAVLTVVLWWIGRTLRRRYGSGEAAEPGTRDRTIAAAIDGLGLVLVPILAVWLVGQLLAVSKPPPPIDVLLSKAVTFAIILMLVLGVTSAALAPKRAPWRVLPFTDDAAQQLSTAVRRLFSVGMVVGFIEFALTQGPQHEAVAAVAALALTTIVALLTLPALANRAWQAARPEGSERSTVIGGTWWSIARLVLSVVIVSPIVIAAWGYSTLGDHIQAATANACLIVALALMFHRFAADLLDAIAAPDSATGSWVRRRFGLASDAPLRGVPFAILLVDLVLAIAIAILVPAVWGIDMDAILTGFGQALHGVRIGGVRISLENIGAAILGFLLVMVLARLVRSVMRDRVLPTVEAPLPLRQSIDAALNYAGVIIAILVGIAALGIDFTNLAIVLGALSVGIGLGLQGIANNVISGVILLVERPIKAGDWVSVAGHEGFVRRINIRATEIETFQRTHVIVPNSVFLQNPVVNRTYADTSSRIDIALTVGLATDVARLEGILRDLALGHPRVLRVPQPIVRFMRLTPVGLDFELFVFVGQLEDRNVVQNELNAALLARLIEEKIVDPRPAPEYQVRGLDRLADALAGRPRPAAGPAQGEGTDHAASPPR